MLNIGRLALGLVLSLLVGGFAYRRGWLTRGGVAGAALIGTSVFGIGGWVWGGLVVAFFVSSSILSYYGKVRKAPLAEKFAKGSRRDLAQTLANGGLAALLAVAAGLAGKASPAFPPLAFGFYGALAAVSADTWATELGVLASRSPRLITTGQPVVTGTSGGVSMAGTLAALAGALFIGTAAFVLIEGAALVTLGGFLAGEWRVLPAAAIGGFAGALGDSLLGATAQAGYLCPSCGIETEQPVHRCGQRTRLVRGWRWLNNDGVNFAASLIGAVVAAATWFLL